MHCAHKVRSARLNAPPVANGNRKGKRGAWLHGGSDCEPRTGKGRDVVHVDHHARIAPRVGMQVEDATVDGVAIDGALQQRAVGIGRRASAARGRAQESCEARNIR